MKARVTDRSREGTTSATAAPAHDEQHLAKIGDQRDSVHGSHLCLAFAKPFCEISCDDCLFLSRLYARRAHRHFPPGPILRKSALSFLSFRRCDLRAVKAQ